MATPNYKLKNDHAAAIGHVRELYQKVVDEFVKKTATSTLNMNNYAITNILPVTDTAPSLNDPEKNNAITKQYLWDKFTRQDGALLTG